MLSSEAVATAVSINSVSNWDKAWNVLVREVKYDTLLMCVACPNVMTELSVLRKYPRQRRRY